MTTGEGVSNFVINVYHLPTGPKNGEKMTKIKKLTVIIMMIMKMVIMIVRNIMMTLTMNFSMMVLITVITFQIL